METQSVKQTIAENEADLKRIKKSFSEVMTKLKKDCKEYNASYIGEVARRLVCFYFGEYAPYYDMGYKFARKFKLSKGQKWSQGESRFINEDYYNIHDDFGNRVGFVCEKSDIFEAIGSEGTLKFWCWYCERKGYKESLETFIKDFNKKDNPLNIMRHYNDYLNRNHEYNHIFELINEPSIKVKNMVLCLKCKN